VRHLAELQILSKTPYSRVNAKRELVPASFVVYRDEAGRVGTVVMPKAEPSLAEVKAEIEKRKKGA